MDRNGRKSRTRYLLSRSLPSLPPVRRSIPCMRFSSTEPIFSLMAVKSVKAVQVLDHCSVCISHCAAGPSLPMPLVRHCIACTRAARPQRFPLAPLGRFQSSSRAVGPAPREIKEDEDDFEDVIRELHRRKKVDEKRNQKGADFVDFLRVTVRGGASESLNMTEQN